MHKITFSNDINHRFMGNILNNFTGGGRKQSQPQEQSQPQARMEDMGPPIYDPMNKPPFSNPQPPSREMPSSNSQNNNAATSDIDALLSNISGESYGWGTSIKCPSGPITKRSSFRAPSNTAYLAK